MDHTNQQEEPVIVDDDTLASLPSLSRLQLSSYNGVSDPKIYVAIRGLVYDVTQSPNYAPGKAYHKLAGKDVSRLLGLNKLQLKEKDESKMADAIWGENTWATDDLTPKQNAVVDKWIAFFRKRYDVVAVVVDHETSRTRR